MAETRPLYIGPRLKRLRRELGLTQQAMADDLEISASYVALLERNQRPVTADMLLRLARTYALDIGDLADEDGEAYGERINAILRDPIFTDIDLPALEVADLATNFPGVSEALLRLYGAYTREQQALARSPGSEGREAADPVAEARAFIAAQGNYIDSLDSKAEALSAEIEKSGGLNAWIRQQGVRVRFLPPDVMSGSQRRFDRHNQQLLISDGLDRASRAFQMATHVAYTAMRGEIGTLVRSGEFATKTAEALSRRALASYAAAAILMPYGRFRKAVGQRAYDIESLGRLFGASFEQVAHRLACLGRSGQEGVSFFFLRIDEGGNISKRLEGADFAYPAHASACPLWSIHSIFRNPGEIVPQWLEYPDGQRFFSIARTVRGGGGEFDAPRIVRALALVCKAEDANALIYARGVAPGKAAATPVGVTCRLCHRASCSARSEPPIGREILPDDFRRGFEPFTFTEI